MTRLSALLLSCAALAACGDSTSTMDAGGSDASHADMAMLADTSVVDGGPHDAGVADTGPADTGPADIGPVDAGPIDPMCTEALAVLDCTSGTVSGNTAAGASMFTDYCGGGGTSYSGNEAIYAFQSATAMRVTVAVTSTATAGDWDLFAYDPAGAGCDASDNCVDSSASDTPNETVHFLATAGTRYYLSYDNYTGGTAGPMTTAFMLTVTCHAMGCGDGVLDTGEACDDGNNTAGDGCSATCTVETGFGCDTGSPTTCHMIACGDGLLDGAEACDDGNAVAADGCSATCAVETGSWCASDPHAMPASTCRTVACGDGNIDATEHCDDGNAVGADGCSATCTVEAGFTCDTSAPSVCTAAACGDGTLGGTEQCDDGNTTDGDGCSATCTVEAGFGCVAYGDGDTTCTMLDCGDGTQTAGEGCDDGNMVAADGCSATCTVESGFRCEGFMPSMCMVPTCGNGTRTAGEACDDGNTTAGDGCSPTCTIEGATAVPAAGATTVLNGTLLGTDPTFTRANYDCTTSTHLVHYDTFVLQNTGAAARTFDLTLSASGDGYLELYDPPFDATMALARCLRGNDDWGGDHSRIQRITLAPGAEIVVVVTEYDTSTAIGPYDLSIDG